MSDDIRERTIAKLKAKPGRKAAIEAMCCTCIYDPDALGSGSWRKQVQDCTTHDCPLYNYRPLSKGGTEEDGS